MPTFRIAFLACWLLPAALFGQAEYRVYSEHPRIFLDNDRLRRLTRDAERETPRWRRLQGALAESAELVELPLAQAMAFQAAEDEGSGRAAVQWALTMDGNWAPGDLRLAALVFDWCQALLSDTEREQLVESLAKGAESASQLAGLDITNVRDGLLASIALAGHWDGSEAAIGRFVEKQWGQDILPLLEQGQLTDQAHELIAVLEISHAFRTNLERDLWLDAPNVFDPLPIGRILSYLPGWLQSDEGRLRNPFLLAAGADPAREALLGRIAEMLLVAYKPSTRRFQYLQGWLRNDSFTLKGALGTPYEFLWLNPYLPGLSPSSGLALVHDPIRGRLFARQGWDDSDLWIGYSAGWLNIFAEGRLSTIRPEDKQAPIALPGAAIVMPQVPSRVTVNVPEGAEKAGYRMMLIGLHEGESYAIRINRDDALLYTAGRGGIIAILNNPGDDQPKIKFRKQVRIDIRKAMKAPARRAAPTLKGV